MTARISLIEMIADRSREADRLQLWAEDAELSPSARSYNQYRADMARAQMQTLILVNEHHAEFVRMVRAAREARMREVKR